MSCPYLSTRSKDGTYYSYPSRGNVCHAQPGHSRTRLLFRKRRPYVPIPKSRQEELCLKEDAHLQCPLFKHAADKR